MAVTITVAELAAACRIGSSAPETAQVTRLRTWAITAVTRYLGDAYATAPAEVVNEAVVRAVGYAFDAPNHSFADALRNSGATAVLSPHKSRRAGVIG